MSRRRRRHGFTLGRPYVKPPDTTEDKRSKATTVWSWANEVSRAAVAAGEREVLLNLGETSVAYFEGRNRGNVPSKQLLRDRASLAPAVRASRDDLRINITHVGALSTDRELQRHPPQYIIANETRCIFRL